MVLAHGIGTRSDARPATAAAVAGLLTHSADI